MRNLRCFSGQCLNLTLEKHTLTLIDNQMDLGVGSFVFSQGIVSALPLIKDPQYLKAPMLPKIFTTIRKCSPLLLLGVIRTLSVKGTDYPVSVFDNGQRHATGLRPFWHPGASIGIWNSLELLLHSGFDTDFPGPPASFDSLLSHRSFGHTSDNL